MNSARATSAQYSPLGQIYNCSTRNYFVLQSIPTRIIRVSQSIQKGTFSDNSLQFDRASAADA